VCVPLLACAAATTGWEGYSSSMLGATARQPAHGRRAICKSGRSCQRQRWSVGVAGSRAPAICVLAGVHTGRTCEAQCGQHRGAKRGELGWWGGHKTSVFARGGGVVGGSRGNCARRWWSLLTSGAEVGTARWFCSASDGKCECPCAAVELLLTMAGPCVDALTVCRHCGGGVRTACRVCCSVCR
jgi:hypothetical protein